ncbi:MAG: diacylglycerol kinase [Nitrospirota bacterium]|jgi:diacylglycerol kinase (ATP)
MPLRQWIRSANYAIEGILHAAKTQRHLRYHFYAAAFVLVGSYALGVTRNEFLFISLAVIAVLMVEMLNSAMEAMVDLFSPEYSEQARNAKDIAAGAVLITAAGAAVMGTIILLPYLKDVFRRGLPTKNHPPDEIAVMAFVVVLIAVVLMKAYFGKGHPFSGGIPSGHAALAFSIWVSVTYCTGNLMASVLSLILALLIAQSRIATKVHKPGEVALGAIVGAGITALLFQFLS